MWMHRCQLFCHTQGLYLNENMQVAKHYLFRDGGSCRMEINNIYHKSEKLESLNLKFLN